MIRAPNPRYPDPADHAASARLIDVFGAAGGKMARLLAAIGGNSPYLRERASAEPALLRAIAADGPRTVIGRALATLATTPFTAPRAEIAASLRLAKRQVALATAIGDIGGVLDLAGITGALSDLAEATLTLATNHLLASDAALGKLHLPNSLAPAQGCGFVVLAMGKLGARELNYSSDIDLILLHDPDLHPYSSDGVGQIFARLARDLTGLMSTIDAGGYVFRVDLRLRPDPASTPPCVSLLAALAYYESQGQTWERAAMIKARPVAGDLAMGARFLADISPFVWRRYLDFAAIADIRAMKQRIDAHKGTSLGNGDMPAAQRLLGHNLKLGQGGIREIEFCAQTLQLVWGGRAPGLRLPATLDALAALAAAGHLPAGTAAALADAYQVLRRTEHRLQMVDDRQTHSLPATLAGLDRFAVFMGMADGDHLATHLLAHMAAVHAAFTAQFDSLPNPPDTASSAGHLPPPIPAAFTRPEAILAATAAWEQGRPRALRTDRARGLLLGLLPKLLTALARQTAPDAAFARFDDMLWRLPAGVQVFSMFGHHPELLDRLADVLGAAPFLADHLASVPAALEGFLTLTLADHHAANLGGAVRGAASVDDALARVAPLVRAEEFRLALGELDGRLGIDAAGLARSRLAEATIGALLPVVLADHRRRFGRIAGGGLVVVALGKAGSREMLAGSDLDLMVIYQHPDDAESTGPKRLAASPYFGREAQSLVAALTTPTRDGPLYSVDMRLRPSGSKGPVAVSLAGFVRYHRDSARSWERLALTRARVVAGPRGLAKDVRAAIRVAILQAGDPGVVRADTAAMRVLLAREMPAKNPWDVKRRAGGLMEVEFIAQCLQLTHATRPGVLQPTTRVALRNLARAGVLVRADADLLIHADQVWRGVQGLLRITLGGEPPAVLPEPVLARLPAMFGAKASAATLEVDREQLAAQVRAIFVQLVGPLDGGDQPIFGAETAPKFL